MNLLAEGPRLDNIVDSRLAELDYALPVSSINEDKSSVTLNLTGLRQVEISFNLLKGSSLTKIADRIRYTAKGAERYPRRSVASALSGLIELHGGIFSGTVFLTDIPENLRFTDGYKELVAAHIKPLRNNLDLSLIDILTDRELYSRCYSK